MERYFPKIPKRCPEGQEQPAAKKTKTEAQTSAPGSGIQGATMSAFGEPAGLAITDIELGGDSEQRVEKALLESGVAEEMEDDEDDEKGPAPEESDLDTSFAEDSQEVLAYLGVDHENANSWSEILLTLCVGLPMWEYLDSLKAFLQKCTWSPDWRPVSLSPTGDFMLINDDWASHDLTIDEKWAAFTKKVRELSGDKIDVATLVKPSGPSKAVLTTQWHFPTWVTESPLYGSTMDHTNPSLRAQFAKFKHDPYVKTQDTLPIREDFIRGGVKWDKLYANWPQIKETCLEFTRWLNRNSKIIMIVGEENVRSWQNLIELDDTVEAIKVEFKIDLTVFGETPCFQIIRSKLTKEIQQIVLFSYHSQYFFYRDISMRIRAWHDLLWNAAAEWANIKPAKPSFFLRQSDVKQSSGNNPKRAGDKYGFTQLNLARKLRAQEKRTGKLFPEFVIQKAFRKTINKNPAWTLAADPKHGSFLLGIMLMWQQKINATQSTNEYRKSEGGRRQFSVAIDTLSKHKKAAVEASKKARQTDEYKASESNKKRLQKLSRAHRVPKNKGPEKMRALRKVKQVVELLTADLDSLTPHQAFKRAKFEKWDTLSGDQQRTFFSKHVAWWAPDCPSGLRYEGDGCPDKDTFDYEGTYHPAVVMDRNFRKGEKEKMCI
ncbi:hypothetical protein BHE90_002624 [Fusarium euwallaceae]|uniref:Uncharacterized protein n=1 Tax=Fusarium euwallaceae TaxID=1147111 RepID=A0A430M4B0_9HYPO|nr:hypothetical protein BHE90_002624 [Fusarium euwallaceae]